MDAKGKRILPVVKWSLFGVELALLGFLFLMAFLVPVMPPPSPGKAPEEIIIALSSAATALACGKIFVQNSGQASSSLASLLRTLPCVVFLVVLGAMVILPVTTELLDALLSRFSRYR